jgi:hypothetical protein
MFVAEMGFIFKMIEGKDETRTFEGFGDTKESAEMRAWAAMGDLCFKQSFILGVDSITPCKPNFQRAIRWIDVSTMASDFRDGKYRAFRAEAEAKFKVYPDWKPGPKFSGVHVTYLPGQAEDLNALLKKHGLK